MFNFQILIIFLITKVLAAPVPTSDDMAEMIRLMASINDKLTLAVNELKTYQNAFAHISSTLSDIVPSVSNDLITLFTLLS
jgi:hypothetical protein